MANECVVYHKHLAGMDLTDGYIGISKHFDDRMKQHHRDAFVKHSIYTVHDKMRMHGDEVITTKIFEGTVEECFDYEEHLRPKWHMGWNMAIGGGRPGSGWKPGKDWLDNRLWHPEHGEITISKDLTIREMVDTYIRKNAPSGTSGGISRLLSGKLPRFVKWELANAQLVNKVETRYYMDWKVAYLTNGQDVVKLNKSGFKYFAEHVGVKPKLLNVKTVITGLVNSCRGYVLTTEEEWLETAERVEFK